MEIWEATPKDTPGVHLVDLVYELLDAHQDTMQLARDGADAFGWEAHIDYLRRLQRVGREALARSTERLTAGAPTARAPGSASRRRWGSG
jgi:hypothetical protein